MLLSPSPSITIVAMPLLVVASSATRWASMPSASMVSAQPPPEVVGAEPADHAHGGALARGGDGLVETFPADEHIEGLAEQRLAALGPARRPGHQIHIQATDNDDVQGMADIKRKKKKGGKERREREGKRKIALSPCLLVTTPPNHHHRFTTRPDPRRWRARPRPAPAARSSPAWRRAVLRPAYRRPGSVCCQRRRAVQPAPGWPRCAWRPG